MYLADGGLVPHVVAGQVAQDSGRAGYHVDVIGRQQLTLRKYAIISLCVSASFKLKQKERVA